MSIPISERIVCICNELRQEIKSFINESDTENQPNLSISKEIDSITSDISNEILPKIEGCPVTTELLHQQEVEIGRVKASLLEISNELQAQTSLFNEEISKEKQKLKARANELSGNYEYNFQNLYKAHQREITELEDKLSEMKITFDSRILEEKTNVITKKMVLKQTYDSLKVEYDSMRSELENKLNEANQQINDLEQEISTTYGSCQIQINELLEKINNSKNEREAELSRLESENEELRDKIDSIKKENDRKIQDLQQKVDEEQNNFESKLSEQLKINQSKLDSEIDAITQKYQTSESELTAKLDLIKNSRSDQTDSLQSELIQLKSKVNSIDSKIAKKLKVARTQLESKIIAKDSEIKQLRSDNKKFIETTRHSYQNELSRLKNENENQLVLLEQSLMKTVANSNPQTKPKFSIKQPTEAPKAPLHTARRMKATSTRNIEPVADTRSSSQISTLASIEEQFEMAENESRKRTEDFAVIKRKAENEMRTNRAKACAQINEIEKAAKVIQEEIDDLKNKIKEKEEEEENQHQNSSIENSEKPSKCSELLDNIEQQRILIQQLKEEKDRLRVDLSKNKKALQDIHLKLRNDMNDIDEKIKNSSEIVEDEIDKISSKMQIAHQEERKKTDQLLQEATLKLELILKEFIDNQNKAEEMSINDTQKWSELRSGIADSTLSICKKLNASNSTQSSKLPPLKK